MKTVKRTPFKAAWYIKSFQAVFPSFSRRGVRDNKTKRGEATLCGANGVVKIESRSAPYFVEVTNHPVCAARNGAISLVAQPPLLGKEGNVAFKALIIGAAIAFAALPVSAQRSFSMTYDASRQVNLQGVVTRIDWVNPSAFFFIDVRDTAGTVTNWAIQINGALELERDGWKPSALHIGDQVIVDGTPARGEIRQASAKSVVLTKTGKKLFTNSATRRAVAPAAPAPRWSDGQVRLGPPAGKKGYWGTASTKSIVENTAAKIPMSDDGLLVNLADAGKVAPLQPWAKALFEHRQRTFFKDDPLARCIPAGGPRQFQMPNGFQFVEQKELGRVLVLFGGGDRNWRVIYTDGRPQGTAAEQVPSYYGNSVGHWEKDTLVVDSVGYNEKFWLSSGGLPSTEELHLIERFTRTDLNTLKYEVTIDDPRTYTRSWTAAWTMPWIPDQDIQEYFCEDNAETTFIR